MADRRPAVGGAFKRKGQKYLCVGLYGYTKRNGREIVMYVLISECAECGRDFETSAANHQIQNGGLTRRCGFHHAPGRPVVRARNLPAARKGSKATNRLNAVLS